MSGLALRLLGWPARRPALALAIGALLAALAAVSAARLRADASIESLFPPDQPGAAALGRVLDDFPSADEMLVLATTPGQTPRPRQLLEFGDWLTRELARDPQSAALVGSVQYKADAQYRDFITHMLAPNGLLYLNDAEFARLRDRLTPQAMRRQLERDEAMLAAPGPAAGGLAKAMLQDPLRLHEFLESRLAGSRPIRTYQGGDAFISEDGRSLLVRVAGTRPLGDLAFCTRITSAVEAAARRVNVDGLELDFSGGYPIADWSQRGLRRDSISSVIGSIVCLALLFAAAFPRSWALFPATFAPVALGVLYGFGAYAIVGGALSPLSAVIGAALAGIGIDYAIFYLVNYRQRRAAGAAPIESADATIAAIASPLAAAWVTSVVGFVAIAFASTRALFDFSLLGSLGLAGALACVVLLLPALLVSMDRWLWGKSPAMARFDLGPAIGWIDRRAGACAALGVGLMALTLGALAAAGPTLELEPDPAIMHPRPNPPLDAEARIEARMHMAPASLLVYLRTSSPMELASLAHRVDDRLLGPGGRKAGVVSTMGLATLLPDPAVAADRMKEPGPAWARQVQGNFDSAVAHSDFSPRAFAPYRAFLGLALAPARAPGVADLLAYPRLAREMLSRQALEGAPAVEAITVVSLGEALRTEADRERTVAELRQLLSGERGATLTGMSVLSQDAQATIRRELPRLIGAAAALCAVYLLLHFRSLSQTLLATLPSLCSLTCVLAVAKLCSAKMNLANMISIPLLIGVDIDYGIFLVSAARASRSRAELRERARASGLAVLLCASATTLGFGSLAFTSSPAIRSLGWAVAIGAASCAASSLLLLLPLLLWLRGRKDRATTSGAPPAVKVITILAGLAALSIVAGGSAGCAAPTARLSFPTAPIAREPGCDWYDVHHDGRRSFGVARDSAGNVDRLLYRDRASGGVDREYRLADYSNGSVPHLILLLDSIPYQTMLDRYEAGDFRWFGRPSKMIAPFPSMTQVCYSDVLGCPPLPSANDQFYDPRDDTMHDRQLNRILGQPQPYERRLTYRAKWIEQGLSFLDPDDWYAAELERVRRAVERSPERVTIAYIASASPMVCVNGRAGAERVLDGARRLCLQLLYERRGAIKISMMADHGHNYMPSKNVSLSDLLSSAGFHPTDKLVGDDDCVVESNALVTYAGIHTRRPDAVARALCARAPVELAIYMRGPRVIVRSAQGSAAIECRAGRLRYEPIDADVLGYSPTIAGLKAEGKMDADGFADDSVWYARTIDLWWPNAPRRVWDALHGELLEPPTVMLALKDGYCAGKASYEKWIDLQSTHGGLNQVNSATFVATMTGRLDGPVREQDVLNKLEPGWAPRVR